MKSGKRVSSSMSLMTYGRWFCQTHPEGDSSMATSEPVCFSTRMRVSRTCRRITFFAASGRTRERQSKAIKEGRRGARAGLGAGGVGFGVAEAFGAGAAFGDAAAGAGLEAGAAAGAGAAGLGWMETSSTSKTSVEFGPITGGLPEEP